MIQVVVKDITFVMEQI
ncbi:hypothetical protein Avbf_06416 [Armadillidium vulgare]|nr:hypothetical protein Avbf_06416 [Armadillidium vulgare]